MTHRFKVFILFCLLFVKAMPVTAQAPLAEERIEIGSGFLENIVLYLLKDHAGYLWVGGYYGLYRYDGHKMTDINDMLGLEGHLPQTSVNSIAEDSAGNLWIQTAPALYRYNPVANRLEEFINTTGCRGRQGAYRQLKTAISEDGKLWFLCIKDGVLYQVLGRDSLSVAMTLHTNQDEQELTRILQDSGAAYFVNASEAATIKKTVAGYLTAHFDRSELLSPGARIYCVDVFAQTADERYTMLTTAQNKFLLHDNTAPEKLRPVYRPSKFHINDIKAKDNGNFWMISSDTFHHTEIYTYNNKLDAFTEEASRDGLNVDCILTDAANLWLGTFQGLRLLHGYNPAFRNYLTSGVTPITDVVCCSNRAILELNDSELLCSTYSGLGRVNLKTGKNIWVNTNYYGVLYDIEKTLNGNIMGISFQGTLVNYDPSTNTQTITGQLPGDGYSLCEDNDQNVWIGGYSYLDWLPKKGGRPVVAPIQTKADISNTSFKHLYKANDTTIYITSSQGLLRLNPRTKQMSSFKNLWTSAHLLVPDIYHCYAADSVNLWLATQSGLQHIDLSTGKIEIYGTENGLAHSDVVSIQADNDGNLWMGTSKGLSCFLIKKKQFINFTQNDGIANNEFNFRASAKLTNGQLAFGSISGMTVFEPAKALAAVTNAKFPLVVTRLAIYDAAQKKIVSRETGAAQPSKIDLQPFDRFFELDVAILNYAEPEGHQFNYYLENFDDNWIDNGHKSTIRYTNLPAGNYTLHLKGRDQRGVWTDEILIPVIVHQVFYKKAWFWILCAGLVFLLTFLIYQFRINQLNQLHAMRMKIAADLHDEVGSALTDIAVQAELAQLEGKTGQAAALEKITQKLQEAVGSMRDVIWTVSARNDTAGKLLEHMESHLYTVLPALNVTCSFSATGIEPGQPVDGVKRQNIFLIFKEAIANIVKHSNATHVEVTIEKADNCFKMIIRDNGTVINTRFAGNGIGLESMRNRAAKMGGQLFINSVNGYEVQLSGEKIL